MNTPFIYKKCVVCGKYKIVNETFFNKNSHCRYGFNSRCKECVAKQYYQRISTSDLKLARLLEQYHSLDDFTRKRVNNVMLSLRNEEYLETLIRVYVQNKTPYIVAKELGIEYDTVRIRCRSAIEKITPLAERIKLI